MPSWVVMVVLVGLVLGLLLAGGFFSLALIRLGRRFELSLAAFDQRAREESDRLRTALETSLRESARTSMEVQCTWSADLRSSVERIREQAATTIADRFVRLQNAQTAALAETRRELTSALTSLQVRVEARLDQVRLECTGQLEKIRSTVHEKLENTLELRLGESFRLVSERLEQLHRGLGEMQALATGVGDLKKVLSNVRARGTFGEVQLAALLEQVLAPEQYETNVATVPGASERVEFAIKLPGREDGSSPIYLPIDAKFPLEDYQRLQQAYEDSNAVGLEEARKALRTRILAEALAIRTKYVSPPHTTDFALLFLPTEGLYAEVLRIPGLSEELQSRQRIAIVGPTTLFAVLSSLQMGFRTLAIERRSSEVWTVLGAVKTEFSKFGRSLESVSKKLQEAGNKIAETTQRTRVMERKLRAVEVLPDGQVQLALGGGSTAKVLEADEDVVG